MTSMTDRLLPSRADLDAATARTAAAMANPAARPSDRLLVAKAEEAIHLAYLRRPGADAELRAEAEAAGGKLAGASAEGAYWPEDQPVPYMLTAKGRSAAHSLEHKTSIVRRSRTPHRSWALTAKAEALLAAEDGTEQTS